MAKGPEKPVKAGPLCSRWGLQRTLVSSVRSGFCPGMDSRAGSLLWVDSSWFQKDVAGTTLSKVLPWCRSLWPLELFNQAGPNSRRVFSLTRGSRSGPRKRTLGERVGRTESGILQWPFWVISTRAKAWMWQILSWCCPIECLWDKRQGAARELVIKKLRGQWKLPLKIKLKDLNLLSPLLPFPRLRNSLCVAPWKGMFPTAFNIDFVMMTWEPSMPGWDKV